MTGLRIALLLHSPSGGGAQRRTLELAGALAIQGAAVRLVRASAESALADQLPANVEIVVWCGVVWCGVVWCGAGRGGAGRGHAPAAWSNAPPSSPPISGIKLK